MQNLISIIIPTLGRTTELDALLSSIYSSIYKNFEIIVVDQNCSDILDEIIKKYADVLICKHLKVSFKGAAKARNYGASFASGEYLFFPDDDAELLSYTLDVALETFDKSKADVVFGKCIDRSGNDSVAVFSQEENFLSLQKYDNMFIEATMVIKKSVFLEYLFDETLGVGTFHGAEEAYDLVLRMLYDKIAIFYTPKLHVYHPNKVTDYKDADIKRVFTYRCGFAKLCQNHNLHKKYYNRLIKVLLYLPYTFVFKRDRSRYYFSELLGLIAGKVIR